VTATGGGPSHPKAKRPDQARALREPKLRVVPDYFPFFAGFFSIFFPFFIVVVLLRSLLSLEPGAESVLHAILTLALRIRMRESGVKRKPMK